MFGTQFMFGTNRQLFIMDCTVVPNILLAEHIMLKLGFPSSVPIMFGTQILSHILCYGNPNFGTDENFKFHYIII